jgi:murein DD-endopeptidase MepM/ murein hydrolase activator NlpD
MATYYAQRTSAGLIVTEGTSPSPNGLGYARIPGIFNDEQIEGWKNVTGAVHQKGGRIFVQLMHTGRIAHPANIPEGGRVVAPSPVRAQGNMWTDTQGMQPHPVPEAMSAADIENAIREYTRSAQNAIEAGFDGVEIHAANGYLPEQFLNPHANIRTDEYGGSITNSAGRSVHVTGRAGGTITLFGDITDTGTGILVDGNSGGSVSFAGDRGGYGNLVEIQHPNGYSTRYAHLSRITVRAHQAVRQGDVIGHVGMTGLATGPHLHYEFHANGRPVDPNSIRHLSGEPLPQRHRAAFDRSLGLQLAYLERSTGSVQLASRIGTGGLIDAAE